MTACRRSRLHRAPRRTSGDGHAPGQRRQGLTGRDWCCPLQPGRQPGSKPAQGRGPVVRGYDRHSGRNSFRNCTSPVRKRPWLPHLRRPWPLPATAPAAPLYPDIIIISGLLTTWRQAMWCVSSRQGSARLRQHRCLYFTDMIAAWLTDVLSSCNPRPVATVAAAVRVDEHLLVSVDHSQQIRTGIWMLCSLLIYFVSCMIGSLSCMRAALCRATSVSCFKIPAVDCARAEAAFLRRPRTHSKLPFPL